MTFLPIVERELRVAARKPGSFWLRVVAALVALVIGCGFLVLSVVLSKVGAGGTVNLGAGLFGALTWLSLAAALTAGLFFTSDCLSEEKREGTLGFLFLTDLRGYDVVLGKLLATSLRGFYALLAIFPILAITLLMGGVTGAQFWKTVLALVNALFFSLVAGMLVSSVSRASQKAMTATLLLLLLLVGGGPAVDSTIAGITGRGFMPALSLTSPAFLFVSAGGWGAGPFWYGLLCNQLVGWLLFGSACLLIPRTWQERRRRTSVSRESRAYRLKYGGVKRRARLRRKLIELNPVLWLTCRERWQSLALWVVAILLVGGFAAMFAGGQQSEWWMVWSYLGGLLTLVLYLRIASQAGRLFVEAQRNGCLELLLVTPLEAKQVVQGQWRGLVRMFGVPLALCLVAQLAGTFLAQQATWGRVAATSAATPPAKTMGATTNNAAVTMVRTTNGMTVKTVTTTAGGTTSTTYSTAGFAAPGRFVSLAIAVAGTLTVIANLAALSWFGMWMGLNSRSTNLATLKTIVFVQIIPWFVISFASSLLLGLVMVPLMIKGVTPSATSTLVWLPLLSAAMAGILSVAKDIFFWLWARRKLYSEFRERAARATAPMRLALPPPLPRVGTPPVMAAQP